MFPACRRRLLAFDSLQDPKQVHALMLKRSKESAWAKCLWLPLLLSVVPSTHTLANAQPLTITTAAQLPSGTAGAKYSQTLAVSDATPPYTWMVATGALSAAEESKSTT
jgi:hypothetical protein